jgi:hypothetical protein
LDLFLCSEPLLANKCFPKLYIIIPLSSVPFGNKIMLETLFAIYLIEKTDILCRVERTMATKMPAACTNLGSVTLAHVGKQWKSSKKKGCRSWWASRTNKKINTQKQCHLIPEKKHDLQFDKVYIFIFSWW